MQYFYSDSELNNLANEINKDVTEVGEALMAWMGVNNKATFPNSDMLKKIADTPVKFARELFMKNKGKLNRIEIAYGSDDEHLKLFSNNLTQVILGIVAIPLTHAEMMSRMKIDSSSPEVINLNQQLTEGAAIIQNIKQLKTTPQTNSEIIQVERRFNSVEKRLNPSSGCFVATFAYEDYNAIEVIKFREFRDRVLVKSKFGIYFIRIYYKLSPSLVHFLSNFPKSKNIIRKILNFMIKFLK